VTAEASGARRDNLKEIVGIGPVVEARLYALGIASFRQLAELDDDGADRLVRVLDGFGDRLVADDWVGQARSLYERHHGNVA
jgi:predicted flap endonuclease-1-like 5' DNA nuclease